MCEKCTQRHHDSHNLHTPDILYPAPRPYLSLCSIISGGVKTFLPLQNRCIKITETRISSGFAAYQSSQIVLKMSILEDCEMTTLIITSIQPHFSNISQSQKITFFPANPLFKPIAEVLRKSRRINTGVSRTSADLRRTSAEPPHAFYPLKTYIPCIQYCTAARLLT